MSDLANPDTPVWLQTLLTDPAVTDICLNANQGVFVDRGKGMQKSGATSEPEIRAWTLAQLAQSGKGWDAKFPFIDATLATGHRLHAAFPPLARPGMLVSLRRLPTSTGIRGQDRWHASEKAFALLREAVIRSETILVSGATGSGKTTLLTDLLGEAPGHQRILGLEDTPELAPAHPHFITLQSRPANADGCGEVTLRTLLKQALRMRPDRIVLGECRGTEVLDLLQCLNTGHRGTLATLHANSSRDACRRLELLCLLSGGGHLPPATIRDLIASGIQWIAHVDRDAQGQRKIRELVRIEGREGDTLLLRPMITN